eukprot:gene31364-53660_t
MGRSNAQAERNRLSHSRARLRLCLEPLRPRNDRDTGPGTSPGRSPGSRFGKVVAMVVISQPIRFDEEDPRPMLQHLDSWARRSLVSPEAWGSTVELCGQWADYSARNQVLLASYGVATPVAGSATWARVESIDGRPCAVRAGEHGLPVRVPVVGEVETAGDRARSTGRAAAVETHRWELVFAQEQLGRAPGSGQLRAPAVPAMGERAWAEAVRLASGRMLGRTPRK